jgi:hypothetical protein
MYIAIGLMKALVYIKLIKVGGGTKEVNILIFFTLLNSLILKLHKDLIIS